MTEAQFEGIIYFSVAALFLMLIAFCWMIFYPEDLRTAFGLGILSFGGFICVAILGGLGYEAITSGRIF